MMSATRPRRARISLDVSPIGSLQFARLYISLHKLRRVLFSEQYWKYGDNLVGARTLNRQRCRLIVVARAPFTFFCQMTDFPRIIAHIVSIMSLDDEMNKSMNKSRVPPRGGTRASNNSSAPIKKERKEVVIDDASNDRATRVRDVTQHRALRLRSIEAARRTAREDSFIERA